MPKAVKTRASSARSEPFTPERARESPMPVKQEKLTGEGTIMKREHVIREEPVVKEEEISDESCSFLNEIINDDRIKDEVTIKTKRSIKQKKVAKKEGNIREEREIEQEALIAPSIPSHAHELDSAPTENYLFLVRIRDIHDPVITRFLSVPSNYTFSLFHDVLQVAFGWTNSHMYQFRVNKIPEDREVNLNLPFLNDLPHLRKIGLRPADMISRLWRGHPQEVLCLVPEEFLEDQMVEDENMHAAAEWVLKDVFANPAYEGMEVLYEYDMGDRWEHEVVFMGREESGMKKLLAIHEDAQAICLGGEGHPAAEDCGGPTGWTELKNVYKRRVVDIEGKKAWYKTHCTNKEEGPLDFYKWNLTVVNMELSVIRM